MAGWRVGIIGKTAKGRRDRRGMNTSRIERKR